MYYDKITKEDMFNKIKSLLPEEKDIVNFCDGELALIHTKAENARARAEASRCDKDDLTREIYNLLFNKELSLTIDEITNELKSFYSPDITKAQVRYRLNSLSRDGLVYKKDGENKNKIYWI